MQDQGLERRLGDTDGGKWFKKLFSKMRGIPGLGAITALAEILYDIAEFAGGDNYRFTGVNLSAAEVAKIESWDTTKFTPFSISIGKELIGLSGANKISGLGCVTPANCDTGARVVVTAGEFGDSGPLVFPTGNAPSTNTTPVQSQLITINSVLQKMAAVRAYYGKTNELQLSPEGMTQRFEYINLSFKVFDKIINDTLDQFPYEMTQLSKSYSFAQTPGLTPLIPINAPGSFTALSFTPAQDIPAGTVIIPVISTTPTPTVITDNEVNPSATSKGVNKLVVYAGIGLALYAITRKKGKK